jgi:hypothetical protein
LTSTSTPPPEGVKRTGASTPHPQGIGWIPSNSSGDVREGTASGHISQRQFQPSMVAIKPALTATLTQWSTTIDRQSSTSLQRPIHRVCRIAQGTRHHIGVQIHGDRKLRVTQHVHQHTGATHPAQKAATHTCAVGRGTGCDAHVCRWSWDRMRRAPDCCTRCSKVRDRFRGSTTVPYGRCEEQARLLP